MKFGICNEMFEAWNIEDVFACAADLGYDGVEIAPFTLADSVTEMSTVDHIRAAAADQGIEIIDFPWLLLKPEIPFMNHPDADICQRNQGYLRQLIRFCGDLGGKEMACGSHKQPNMLEGDTFELTWDRSPSDLNVHLIDLQRFPIRDSSRVLGMTETFMAEKFLAGAATGLSQFDREDIQAACSTQITPIQVPFYQQEGERHCGAACLKMVLEYCGVKDTLDQDTLFHFASEEQRWGTRAKGLASAASQYGRQGKAVMALPYESLLEFVRKGNPVIVYFEPKVLNPISVDLHDVIRRVRWWIEGRPNLLHAVVVVGRVRDSVVFHDPSLPKQLGKETACSEDRFIKAWEYPSHQEGRGIGVIIQ